MSLLDDLVRKHLHEDPLRTEPVLSAHILHRCFVDLNELEHGRWEPVITVISQTLDNHRVV